MSSTDRTLAKRVIVEIIRQNGGKMRNTTNIFKAFYFAHLFYAESSPGYLTEWPIVRMPNGPGVDDGNELLQELADAGHLTRKTIRVGPYPANEYHLTENDLAGKPLSKDAVKAIKEAATFVKGKTATELSNLTHEYSRSWTKAKDGERLNVYIDIIPDDEFEERRASLETIRHRLRTTKQPKDAFS